MWSTWLLPEVVGAVSVKVQPQKLAAAVLAVSWLVFLACQPDQQSP
jgi:hypothetical protein